MPAAVAFLGLWLLLRLFFHFRHRLLLDHVFRPGRDIALMGVGDAIDRCQVHRNDGCQITDFFAGLMPNQVARN